MVGSSVAVGPRWLRVSVINFLHADWRASRSGLCPGGDPNVQLDAGQAAPLSHGFRGVRGCDRSNIGGVDADVSFAGITPKSAGLYQVTVTPAPSPGVSSGSAAPLGSKR